MKPVSNDLTPPASIPASTLLSKLTSPKLSETISRDFISRIHVATARGNPNAFDDAVTGVVTQISPQLSALSTILDKLEPYIKQFLKQATKALAELTGEKKGFSLPKLFG